MSSKWFLGALMSALLGFAGCASGGNGRPDAGPGGDGGMEDAGPMADAPGTDAPPSGACAGQPEGTPCDADGDGCSQDLCRRGACVLGGLAECNDGLSCTTDQCVSTGAMTFRCDNVSTGCVIDGRCFDVGTRNPDEDCQVCDASTPMSWSISTGTCDDGDACTIEDSCSSGTCVGTPNVDAYESNDVRTAANDLGRIDDGAGFPHQTENPTMYPMGDVDWFRFHDSDEFGHAIYPQVGIRDIPSGSNYDLCAYATCDTTCETGTAATFDGLQGCCSRSASNADEEVRLNPDCSGADDSVDVFIHVVQVSGPATCTTPYSLRWGDD